MKEYLKYAEDVISGKIVSCDNIKLAAQRFLDDLKRPEFDFREDKVQKCLDFFSTLRHYTGRHSGKPFILLPWQQFIVANIIGFYWKGTNIRRFTSAYIEIARKAGKTALAAGLCLYFLIADGEDGAEVLLASNSKDQAKIGYELCSNFAKGLDPKSKYLRCYRADIFFDRTKSKLKVLAADDSKLDGFNASMFLLDEYHAAKTSKIRDVLKSSQGMRESPLEVIITTAGFDKSLPCYQLRGVCIDVLNGLKTNDEMFSAIYTLDDGDDWQDPNVWIKSSPNLGVTVSEKYIQSQIQGAINNPSEEVGVKTKTLNVWCDTSDVWIPERYILKSSTEIKLEDFKDCPVYLGIDLAAVSDLTAVSWLIEKDDLYYFKTFYYLPEAALIEKPDRDLYRLWKQTGALTVTPGNVCDYQYVLSDILKYSSILNIQSIGYDQWNSTQFIIDGTSQGLPFQPYSQSIGNFNQPTRELERLILSDKCRIDNSEITRFCFRNVELRTDMNGNIKPDKGANKKKIDGVISMIQALGMYLLVPHYSNELLTI